MPIEPLMHRPSVSVHKFARHWRLAKVIRFVPLIAANAYFGRWNEAFDVH